MAILSNLSGNIQLTDPNTGTVTISKALTASFTGTVSTVAESTLIGTATAVIALPVNPTQLVYIKNLAPAATVTITWTLNGGSSEPVIILQPLGMILMNESNTNGGITALSLQASAVSSPVDYILAG